MVDSETNCRQKVSNFYWILFKKNRLENELVDLRNEFPVVDPMLACRERKQQKSQWREQ